MEKVREGDTVVVQYTGRLEDGTVFDSSEGGNPLEFTVGEGEVIPGLERGVIGMSPGETRWVTVPMELGYGPRIEKRVCELDRKKVPGDHRLEIGSQLQLYRADGLPVMGTVTGISETTYTMDFNHPLAGKTLIFEVHMLDILRTPES